MRVDVKRRKFFYDAQISRLLIQLGTKIFGGYEVVSGTQYDGKIRFKSVPVIYSSMSRTVQYILGGGSDNTEPTLPIMSYSLGSLIRNARMAQSPQLTQEHTVHVRARDADGNLLINQPGKYYTITRGMPVPYTAAITLTIWASNVDQIYQITEQLLPAFNPDLEIQLSNSPLDWSAINSVIYDGSITFEEVVPAKAPDSFITARLSFKANLWISFPVKMTETNFIHDVKINIHEMDEQQFFIYGDNIEITNMPLLDRLEIRVSEEEIENKTGGQ